MYRHWRWALLVATLVVVAMAVRALSVAIREAGGPIAVDMVSDGRIDLTPAQVTSIRGIGKWEFLCMQMEEIVDTTHRRLLLGDEELVRIYRGTVRLGVDMGELGDEWLMVRGDTAFVSLPRIGRLNGEFIDEARTETFYETGSWDGKAREAMYRRAARRMGLRLARSNAYQEAEENGREQVTALMRAFGFRTVVVSFRKD